MQAAVRQAMGRFNVAPSIDFDVNVNFKALHLDTPPEQRAPASYSGGNSSSGIPSPPKTSSLENINKQHWQQLYQAPNAPAPPAWPPSQEATGSGAGTAALTFESAANHLPQTSSNAQPGYQPGEAAACFQVHGQYIFCPVKSGVMVVSQTKAHERVLYEQYLKDLQNKAGAAQQSLFPEKVPLTPADYSLVLELQAEIRALGFDVEYNTQPNSNPALLVKGMPASVQGMGATELFEGIIEQIKNNQNNLSVTKTENMARAMARRTAMKPGQRLVPEEMNVLIDQLFACKNPNYAPDGQRIFYMLNLADIAAFFNQ